MKLIEAFEKAKDINHINTEVTARIVKKTYNGYDVKIEPVQLSLIRNDLRMIVQSRNSFIHNVRAKYGR